MTSVNALLFKLLIFSKNNCGRLLSGIHPKDPPFFEVSERL